ncbi:MAG: hypothetical protein NC084_04655 [Bacteroides sp.]|nr:hypothetical protein [Eubacterium sp.]MCM1418683.1 hypothetical protein [Roseburia sp.]MCM1461987.1 hypothetical protein [Bacteroides sp.]
MRKAFTKGAAALICGAMICSAASCGNTTGTALTIDGRPIRAGIYIFYQMQALSEAASKLTEEQPDLDQSAEDFDLLAQSVEGTSVRDWIKNRTVALCREFIATEEKFEEYGLALTDEETAEIKSYANSMWTEENMYAQYFYGVDIIGDYYEKYGVGQESFRDTYALSYKKDKLFDAIYGESGSLAVSVDELNAAVVEGYALVKYFAVEDGAGTTEEYVALLNSGTAFAAVKQQHDEAAERAEIEAEMAEAAANGEEYEGTLPEEVVVAASEESDLERVLAKDATSPSADFIAEVFAMSAGENKAVTVSSTSTDADGNETTNETSYVVAKLDISANAETMESYRHTELHEMKDDELDAMITETGAALSLSENAAAISKYKIENIMDE